ncbi:hypothetical protein [Pseudoduganella namucuonensis]|uniref:Uncharacterized protein n=1 Tax=Pseudoduganella namucuonensis TaxID=1035707 RepID=A0A1I7M433_9BURK|nr:hypothetical protein [Pseudoduganella namucuonensis]SFV16627.1 hypothetical protein SAMN05216552_10548 [Pseudoduganella namucuonensis]
MAKLSPVNQLVTAIQSQLTGRVAQGRPRKPAGKGGDKAARRDGYAPAGLPELIELRVAQIAPDDPNRGRKAFRVFLEAVLLSHFGAGLANDARFYQMLDDVQDAMEADPASGALVEEAIGHLLSRQG